MSLDISWIAEAFCSHRFAEAYPYMADEIKWNIVGKEVFTGRAAVIERCTRAATFLETVSTTLAKPKIHRAENCIVVEGAAELQDREDQISSVASCDVFQFAGERLVEITSYVIELSNP